MTGRRHTERIVAGLYWMLIGRNGLLPERLLYESDVVNAVCSVLEQKGYTIVQRLETTQQGDDIIAIKDGDQSIKLCIEAKGETSSKNTSSRYGKPFNSSQVRIHVSEAFYKACEVLSRDSRGFLNKAGIALPDNVSHRTAIKRIYPVLKTLGIAIFWVMEGGKVLIETTWDV